MQISKNPILQIPSFFYIFFHFVFQIKHKIIKKLTEGNLKYLIFKTAKIQPY